MSKKKKRITIFQKRKKGLKILEFLVLGFLIFVFSLASLGLLVFIYYTKDLPRPERFTEKAFIESTKFFDRTGEVLLYEMYGEEKRELIPLSDIPEHTKQALIATEDANFYQHSGIDFRGIIRAIQVNLKLREPIHGGSTITQQLIRSTFLTPDKTINRKIKEIVLALEMERRYSKDQILEWYLNQVPFGPNIYGIESASRYYFNKSTKELSVPESAVLAALVQAPGYLSRNKEELLARQNHVLNRMQAEGFLNEDEAISAKEEPIDFVEQRQFIRAPHFILHIQEYLLQKYGRDFLERKGLKIYTTLDINMQEEAEKAVMQGVEQNKIYNAHNAALTAIDPVTGHVLAMVGSANWFGESYPEGCVSGETCLFDPKVNAALYGEGRQPGSAFKPFVYAAAFEKGYTDQYVVIDEETNFGIYGGKPYIPRNYDGLFRGPVTLRQALAQSLNVPSVKVLAYLTGLSDGLEMARKLGITTLNRGDSFYGLSIVLGGGEARLFDMVSAYGVFANHGIKTPPVFVVQIKDSQGNIIEQSNQETGQRIIKIETAKMITDILSDNDTRGPVFGYNSKMYFPNRTVAAKTGTTSEFKDGWIVGYTSSLPDNKSIAAGVWVGNNNNASMRNAPGIVVAAPIWRSFMDSVLK